LNPPPSGAAEQGAGVGTGQANSAGQANSGRRNRRGGGEFRGGGSGEFRGGGGGFRRGGGGFPGAGGERGGRGRQGVPAAIQPSGAQGADTIDALFAPLPPVESRGRVWTFTDKQLKPVDVRLGITDGTFTELLEGESLSVDTQLVTGMTGLETRTQTPAGGGNPFQQGGRGRGGRGGPGFGPGF
jgi:hypothetical protein